MTYFIRYWAEIHPLFKIIENIISGDGLWIANILISFNIFMNPIHQKLKLWHQLCHMLPSGQSKCLCKISLAHCKAFVIWILHEWRWTRNPSCTARFFISIYHLKITFSFVKIYEFLLHPNTPFLKFFKFLSWITYITSMYYEANEDLNK